MSSNIPLSFQPKKLFHRRNGSDELDVFEASGYFSGATEIFNGTQKNTNNYIQKYCMRPNGRMSLDMPPHRENSIPLKAMLIENPMMIKKEKNLKQPSSPGGKLAHFLNSLFNQTSSKKSKSKSTKDEDESPTGWRKKRSSISHFRCANSHSSSATATTATTTAATIMSDSKSPFSTSTSSGFRTPLPNDITHLHTKFAIYKDPKNYFYLKPPPTQISNTPINGNFNKIENVNIKSDLIEKKISFGNGLVDKVNFVDKKQEIAREDIKEFKKFIDDDGGDSDSSSDLFELSNCDLGYCSSGLPVYETTHINSIMRGAPILS